MRALTYSILAVAAMLPVAGIAQAPAAAGQVTVESYYRIKWGSAGEFKELYKRNHQPILEELQRQGFLVSTRMDEPFTHMAGDQRWDLRVTLTYPNAATAVAGNAAYDKAAEAIIKRLYPDEAKLDREEARRFGLLEEHWDVIVTPAVD